MLRKNKKKQSFQTHKKLFRYQTIKAWLTGGIKKTKDKISSSLRLEIFFVVGVSLVIASFIGTQVKYFIDASSLGKREYINYEHSKENLLSSLSQTVQGINKLETLTLEIDADGLKQLRELVENHGIGEGSEQLRDFFNNGSVFENEESFQYYRNNIQSDKEWSDAQLQSLYKKFTLLLEENQWNKQRLQNTINKFFDETGYSVQEMQQKAVLKKIHSLDNNAMDNQLVSSTTYIIDNTGKVLFESDFIKQIDIVKAIQQANGRLDSYNRNDETDNEANLTHIYPVVLNGEIHYLLNQSILKGQRDYYTTGQGTALGWIIGLFIFVVCMIYLTKRKIKYIEYLSESLSEISTGNLDYIVNVQGKDELAKVANAINYMENEIKIQMEAQLKAEKAKNELVTNVAHDLRTPLTSIIGYLGLLKEKRFETEEEYEKYLSIAYTKSEKLKVLIEDLFEYTKLNTQTVTLSKSKFSLLNLLNQLIEEMLPIAEEKQVQIRTHMYVTDSTVYGDIPKLTRVFENVIGNAIKYTQQAEGIDVSLKEDNNHFIINVYNQCKGLKKEDIDRLFERFYRADSSRSSETGGSGLGLAIAKNIIKLHEGDIYATLERDIICFTVKLNKVGEVHE